MIEQSRKTYFFSLVLLFLAISSFVFVTYSWLTVKLEQTYEYNPYLANVDIDLEVCFDNGESCIPAAPIEVSPGNSKTGVYEVLIDDISVSDLEFIENFRTNLIVKSTVDTYIRVKVIKQLILTYTNISGDVIELSVYMNDDRERNFTLYYGENWYTNQIYQAYYYDINENILDTSDNILYTYDEVLDKYTSLGLDYFLDANGNLLDASDNLVLTNQSLFFDINPAIAKEEAIAYENRYYDYLYYQLSVDNNGLTEGQKIPLIVDFPEGVNLEEIYDVGYTLQVGFIVEAVQAEGGPENVWGLPEKPWGGSW
ncbi:MAG: hypothetical protein WC154_05230 [Candidatus Izemoplasmatales bacterium]